MQYEQKCKCTPAFESTLQITLSFIFSYQNQRTYSSDEQRKCFQYQVISSKNHTASGRWLNFGEFSLGKPWLQFNWIFTSLEFFIIEETFDNNIDVNISGGLQLARVEWVMIMIFFISKILISKRFVKFISTIKSNEVLEVIITPFSISKWFSSVINCKRIGLITWAELVADMTL